MYEVLQHTAVMVKSFKVDPSLQARMHQYQIVGRAAPTPKNPTPKIYRTSGADQSKTWLPLRISSNKLWGLEVQDWSNHVRSELPCNFLLSVHSHRSYGAHSDPKARPVIIVFTFMFVLNFGGE